MDDFLLYDLSHSRLKRKVNEILLFLRSHGILVNIDKTTPEPDQICRFMGFDIKSTEIQAGSHNIEKATQILTGLLLESHPGGITIDFKLAQRLFGVIQHVAKFWPDGSHGLRFFYRLMAAQNSIFIPSTWLLYAADQLSHITGFTRRPYKSLSGTPKWFTDASDTIIAATDIHGFALFIYQLRDGLTWPIHIKELFAVHICNILGFRSRDGYGGRGHRSRSIVATDSRFVLHCKTRTLPTYLLSCIKLFPHLVWCPTKVNPADCPTRNRPATSFRKLGGSLEQLKSFRNMQSKRQYLLVRSLLYRPHKHVSFSHKTLSRPDKDLNDFYDFADAIYDIAPMNFLRY